MCQVKFGLNTAFFFKFGSVWVEIIAFFVVHSSKEQLFILCCGQKCKFFQKKGYKEEQFNWEGLHCIGLGLEFFSW